MYLDQFLAVVVRPSFEAFEPSKHPAYSLHGSSFLGLPFRILNIELVKPTKGTTMETLNPISILSPKP